MATTRRDFIPAKIRPVVVHETTAQGFLDILSPVSGMLAGRWEPNDHIYRGHGAASYALVPSAFRQWSRLPRDGPPVRRTNAAQIAAEVELLAGFFALADARGLRIPEDSQRLRTILAECRDVDFPASIAREGAIWPPDDLLSILALAQHYRIPTRLLDWTRHPYVAAYFAAAAAREGGGTERLAVWAFNWGFAFSGSGGASQYPWLARTFKLVTAPAIDIPNLFAQQGLFMLLRERQSESEERGAKDRFRPSDDFRPRPYDTWILSSIGFDLPQSIFHKFTLPRKQAPELLRLLAALGIDASTVYPGYSGVASALRERASYQRPDLWYNSRTARIARARYRVRWRQLQRRK